MVDFFDMPYGNVASCRDYFNREYISLEKISHEGFGDDIE